MDKYTKTVNLKDFCDPLFCEYDEIYKRLKKFMDFVGVKMGQLKDDSGEISFYEEERNIIQYLLKEMGEPYLTKATSHKELGKNLAEVYERAQKFRDQMAIEAKKIQDVGLKDGWLKLIVLFDKFLDRLTKTVKLKDFCDPLFCEYDVIYKRLKKFMDFIGLKMDQLKDDYSGEISFYEEERDFIYKLLKEMGEPYLIKVTSHKELGKNLAEVNEHARQFRDRMTIEAEKIQSEDLKNGWLNLIDLLGKKEANELNVELVEKIQKIGDQISRLGLNYYEHVELLKEIHKGIDGWVATRLSPMMKE